MANPEHLKILKQGVDAWNKWRVENPAITPDFETAYLEGADLRRANLSGQTYSIQIYEGRTFEEQTSAWRIFKERTSPGRTYVGQRRNRADLIWASLWGVNLCEADLSGSVLQGVKLDWADFTKARFWLSILSDSDLSNVKGLESAIHLGPSTIGIDTIYKSKGNIPEAFLRGAGVPEDFITYVKSLVGKAIDFYSCFISYSTKDDEFAQRLNADLRAKNVRSWKFDESAKWGEPVWGEIDTAIRHYDKLVVICSRNSLQSVPVIREIERALQKEDREHRNVLFPIRIDDYLFDEWDHPRKPDVVSKVIGDFRGWENHATYAKAFPRFLDALNRPQ